MGIRDDVPSLLEHIKKNSNYLKTNEVLIDIYEGNLLPYVEAELKKQIHGSAFEQAKARCCPINVLRRIVDKLSKIYQQTPVRTLNDEDDCLAWYESKMKLNQRMNIANEYFNLCKSSLVEVFAHNGLPCARAIPNDRFLVYSNDDVDPLRVTHVILIMGKYKKSGSDVEKIYYNIYTDNEFIIVDEDGKILTEKMFTTGNPNGINPYGKLPFFYTSRSFNYLMPKHDTDSIQMSVLIPILLTDLNFAAMYQSFSIVYGINVDDSNIKMSPSAFWSFKSDPTSDVKPELGVLKPQCDVEATLTLIQSEFSMWLNSRGIKSGQIGDLSRDSFASGISKLIDESDTSEERQKQTEFFSNTENDMWDFIINYGHDIWVASGALSPGCYFGPGDFNIKFAEQVPALSRGDIVGGLKTERDAGFTSTHECIKRLNPEYTDSDITALLAEIEEEKTVTIEQPEMIQEPDKKSEYANNAIL